MAIYIKKTNKDAELAQIAALQQEIDLLLQDETIDQSIKNIVLQDLALAQDTIQQDAMVGSNARQYLLGVQDGVKKKLAGELGYSPSAVGSAVKNAFGRYAPEEIAWMVNETLRKSAQQGNSGIYEPVYDAPTTLGQQAYVFNPATEDAKIYKIAGATPDKQQAVKAFSTYLLGQLQSAMDILSDSNNSLHGWDPVNNKHLGNWMEFLSTAGTGSDAELNSQILEMGNIINTLKNSNLQAMYEDNFQYWLEGYAPEKQSTPPAASTTIKVGDANVPVVEYIDDHANSLIKERNWKVVKEGDVYKAYLVGGDGVARPVQNQQIINIDPTNRDTWKRAVITDENGVISYGDLGSDAFIQTLSPSRWAEIQTAIRQAHENHFGKVVDTDKGLGRYIDLSNFFRGTDPIIYQLSPNSDEDPLWIDWDLLGNLDNFVFAGNADATAAGTSTEGQYMAAMGDPGDISSIPEFTEELAKQKFGGNSDTTGDINLKGWIDPTFSDNLKHTYGHLSEAIIQFVYLQIKHSVVSKSIDVDKEAKLKQIEDQIIALCPNYKKQVRIKGTDKDVDLGHAMINQIENDPTIFPSILAAIIQNPEMQDVRQGIVPRLRSYVKQNKRGGILKAQFGVSFDTDDSEESSDSNSSNESSGTVKTQMNTAMGELNPEAPLDVDTKQGMQALLASAIFDFVDLVTPNNNRKAGRVISPIMSTASTGADIYAATQLDMTPEQKAAMFGSDALNMALSFAPFLSKSEKMERLQAAMAARKVQIALGVAGIGASAIGSLFTSKDAIAAMDKILEGKYQDLTPQDMHALVVQANLLISGAKGVSSIAHGVKSTPIKKSDTDVYISVKGPNGKEAIPVKQSDIQAAKDLAAEEIEKLPWYQSLNVLRRLKEKKKAMSSLAPEGSTVQTNILGNPKTKPSYEYDNSKVTRTHTHQDQQRPLKPSVVKNPSMFKLKDDPYFGLFRNWSWDVDLFKNLKGLELEPGAVRSVKTSAGKEYKVYKVSMNDFAEAQKQYLPKSKNTTIDTEVTNALFGPTGMPTDTKIAQSGNIIIYAVPAPIAPVNRNGGRLQRLNMYLTQQ